jgi:hypothetical protein
MKNMSPQQKAMMEQMMKGKMPQQAAPQRINTVYTAKGAATVNGFSCTRYDGVRSGQKIAEVCAAQPTQLRFSPADVQVFEKMREFASGLQSAFQNSPFGGGVGELAEAGFQGFPVERVNFRNGQAAQKDELKSAQQASFSDADFSLGNARKVDMMPAMKGKK